MDDVEKHEDPVRCAVCATQLAASGAFYVLCFDSMLAYGRGPHAHATLPLNIWEVPDVCSHECKLVVMETWPRRPSPEGLEPHLVARHFLRDGVLKSVRVGKLAPTESVPALPTARTERELYVALVAYIAALTKAVANPLRDGAEAAALRHVVQNLRAICSTRQCPSSEELP